MVLLLLLTCSQSSALTKPIFLFSSQPKLFLSYKTPKIPSWVQADSLCYWGVQ